MDLERLRPMITCPLTHQVFLKPVMALDGVTYEESALEKFREVHGDKSPLGKKRSMKPTTFPNEKLDQLISYLVELYPGIQRYDPETPWVQFGTSEEWLEWIQENRVDKITELREKGGDPNMMLEIEGSQISLMNYLMWRGKWEMWLELIQHPLLVACDEMEKPECFWRFLMAEDYQGSPKDQLKFLVHLKKIKWFDPYWDLKPMYQFLGPRGYHILRKKYHIQSHRFPFNLSHLVKNKPYRDQLLSLILEETSLDLNPNSYFDYHQNEYIHTCLERCVRVPSMVQILIAHGARTANPERFFPYPDSLILLLDAGAPLRAKDYPERKKYLWDTTSPWLNACREHPSVVPILLRYQVDLHETDDRGYNALHYLMMGSSSWDQIHPLIVQLIGMGVKIGTGPKHWTHLRELSKTFPPEAQKFIEEWITSPEEQARYELALAKAKARLKKRRDASHSGSLPPPK